MVARDGRRLAALRGVGAMGETFGARLERDQALAGARAPGRRLLHHRPEKGGAVERGRVKAEHKKVKSTDEWDYNPIDESLRAEAQRLARKVAGRITGEVVLHLNDGGLCAVRVREVVKRSE